MKKIKYVFIAVALLGLSVLTFDRVEAQEPTEGWSTYIEIIINGEKFPDCDWDPRDCYTIIITPE